MNGTTLSQGSSAPAAKGWNIALWIAQAILAIMFGMAGVMKLTTPIPQLALTVPWADDIPELLVRFIGLSELAGALGLLLPSLTRIRPRLTVLAGAGLALIMLMAIVFHIARGEASVIGFNVALGAIALFIAWGRLRKAPIAPRG